MLGPVRCERRAKQAVNSPEVRDQLIEENVKLIKFFAKEYARKLFGQLSYDEVYSAANWGLFKAASTYNAERKMPFSSYMGLCTWHRCLMDLRPMKRIPPSISMQTPLWYDGDALTLADVIPDKCKSLEESTADSDTAQQMLSKLSDKHRTIIELLAAGVRQNEIARRLGMTQGNVSNTIKRIQKKMNERRTP
jgi:RNA polymerase sigma factor (sigma-70 family)